MPYILPTFIVPVDIWNNAPIAGAPSVSTLCNLSPGKRQNVTAVALTTNASLGTGIASGYYMEMLLPKLTDIRGMQNSGLQSVVECPKSSGRYYLCTWSDDIGKGFANEHRLALLVQCNMTLVAATTFIAIFGAVPPWPSPLP